MKPSHHPGDYKKFLANKTQLSGRFGFKPTFIPDSAFEFQKALIEWAVEKGRGAIFADCGLGKTLIQLAWAQNIAEKTNGRVLIITPLAVGHQTVREGVKFGIEAARSADGSFPLTGEKIIVTNYERLHYFNPNDFEGVVCDECFPKNTLVEVFENGCILKRFIQDIRHGDQILNASGRDRVIEIHRRQIDRAVKITAGEDSITSSENHPFYTQRGWVSAIDLTQGDYLMETSEALRLVSNGVCAEVPGILEHTLLRDILLSEMEDETKLRLSESAFSERCYSTWIKQGALACVFRSESEKGNRANPPPKSHEQPRNESQGEPPIASDEAQTFRAWWKRDRTHETTSDPARDSARGLESGVRLIVGKIGSRLSNLLQARLSESRKETLHRGGWNIPSQPETTGSKAGCEIGFVRVDGIEILERGHPELEQWRDAQGIVYFYDIKAERHPSFSVNSLLVHNSSILKNFDGATRAAITEFMRTRKYRLLCTATAAPNDYIELGTSSEAVGELGFTDMISRFFKKEGNTTSRSDEHRAGVWRFRGHAEHDFWRWICSWSRAIRKPSDMGFDDGNFKLPPLETRQHIVKAETPHEEFLFTMPACGLAEQRSERRRTLNERCELAAEIHNNNGEASIGWCHLNSEGDLLTKLIPDAEQVSGDDSDERKEEIFTAFQDSKIRVLISKATIAGFGLNFQHCARQTMFPSHSFEQYYQSIRRSWRFGQTKKVVIDIISSEGEASVLQNLQRKADAAEKMFAQIVALMGRELNIKPVNTHTKKEKVPQWL